MKIATWNVNSLRVRQQHVEDWLTSEAPDILCLQELKMQDKEFPTAAFESMGYHSYFNGQKTYNGVAFLSKEPLSDVTNNLPNFDDEQRRYIAAKYKDILIVNVYCPNGQALDSEKFQYKRHWFSKLKETMQSHLEQNEKVVLVGDFNITPADIDVYSPEKWRGKIHCSDIERLMLHKMMATGLYDTFRQFQTEPDQFSWWDYRGDAYSRNEGLRIDLILSSSALLKIAKNCYIDESPRKLERPSDHTPVVVEYDVQ